MEHLAAAARTSGVDSAFPDLLLDIFGAPATSLASA